MLCRTQFFTFEFSALYWDVLHCLWRVLIDKTLYIAEQFCISSNKYCTQHKSIAEILHRNCASISQEYCTQHKYCTKVSQKYYRSIANIAQKYYKYCKSVARPIALPCTFWLHHFSHLAPSRITTDHHLMINMIKMIMNMIQTIDDDLVIKFSWIRYF